MKRGIITAAVLLAVSPATAAWQRVYDGHGVDRFVDRGSVIWALPGLSSSTDRGRAWGSGVEDESDDSDIGDEGRRTSLFKGDFYLLGAGGSSILQEDAARVDARVVRFMGRSLLAVGALRDEDAPRDSILLSSDNGRKWTKVLPERVGSGAIAVFVLDANAAWVVSSEVGGMVVWRTADGGKTWQESPAVLGEPADLFFLDKSRGWLSAPSSSGLASVVYATDDGGKNWEKRGEIETSSGAVHSMRFADKKRGWAAVPGALWETDDGGRTWTPESPPATAAFPSSVGLHYIRDKRGGSLLYGIYLEADDPEDERVTLTTGAIYRLELER